MAVISEMKSQRRSCIVRLEKYSLKNKSFNIFLTHPPTMLKKHLHTLGLQKLLGEQNYYVLLTLLQQQDIQQLLFQKKKKAIF